MINRDRLEEMFSDIRKKTNWGIDGPMLWGYFFTDRDSQKLAVASSALQAQGYRFVDIFVPELDEGVEEYFFLHVEKEEVHTVDSLDRRNRELYAFAEQFNLGSYDGMDVGPVHEL